MLSRDGIIYVYKNAGIPMQPDQSGDQDILSSAEQDFGKGLGLVHRIDRVVSGCCILCKNKSITADISQQFREGTIHKFYLAVTAGEPEEKSGILINTVQERQNRTYISENDSKGRKAELRYARIGSIDRYSVFLVELITGRKHQIRAQLAAAGAPILGDVRYGARRRIRYPGVFLHALQLHFHNPLVNQKIVLNAEVPDHPVWKASHKLLQENISGLKESLHCFRQIPDIIAACSFTD
ncbi:RNA pseudouridine synthase [Spirochaeta dissipatitropha]